MPANRYAPKKDIKFTDLPRPPFLWTVDQVAMVIGVTDKEMRTKYVHYQDLTSGPVQQDLFIARNISPIGENPEWRISEHEVLRWLRHKGFRPRYQPMY